MTYSKLIPKSILFQSGRDQNYVEKRKALSGAFFKSKLVQMTETIKKVTLDHIRQLQAQGDGQVVNMARVTTEL
jgi:cytochrome P450